MIKSTPVISNFLSFHKLLYKTDKVKTNMKRRVYMTQEVLEK